MRTEAYNMACEYMAQVELYDRSLTDKRGPDGSAWIDSPYLRQMSNRYAKALRESYGVLWPEIKAEINKHKNYTPDHWISEWCSENYS